MQSYSLFLHLFALLLLLAVPPASPDATLAALPPASPARIVPACIATKKAKDDSYDYLPLTIDLICVKFMVLHLTIIEADGEWVHRLILSDATVMQITA